MREDCAICGGSGKIRLPVRTLVCITSGASNIPLTMPIREYECPECGPPIPQEKIMVIQAEEWVDERIKDEDFWIHVKRSIGHQMGRLLVDEGMVVFEKRREDTPNFSYREGYFLRGKLGVISPRVVATFEARVAERQKMVAVQVVDQAIKDIRNYGAFYSAPSIQKDIAVNLLLECLHKGVK
jgi:hypothetical protein